jgi:hypothetical protein
MDFSVMTPIGEQLTFGEDSSFELSEHGILVIHDSEMNEQLTLSPTGWTGITEELPATDGAEPQA